MGDVL